jgi:CheY-like chemotaxis protein
VLIVDDFGDAREMYRQYLEFTGYRVAEATSGTEAVRKAGELMPDIILMDLSMPDLDGWQATRLLKSDKRTSQIPVMALTGHALAGHSEGARHAGCDAIVTKPCLPADLVAAIEKMLSTSARKPKRRPRDSTHG